jgi:hypothetical protein
MTHILASTEYDSEAYPDNKLRLDLLHDGVSVLTTFDSKGNLTAQSYHSSGKVAHA